MYTFIVNPHSRSGLGQNLWNVVEDVLKKRHVPYTVFFTQYQKHATSYVRKLTSDRKEHTLIVLGGDGTINEVINGIFYLDKITLGYIPTGSSNDFARSFNIPSDPLKALDTILSPSVYSYMDVGRIIYNNKSRRFAVSTGIGFDAAICHEAVVSKFKRILNKIKLGKFTYALIAIHRIILATSCSASLQTDGQQPITFDNAWFATVMNHPFEGGGLKFCPKAVADDGWLDVIVVSGSSKLKVLCTLPFAFIGKHTVFKEIHIYRCKRADITFSNPLPVHTDGEPIFLQHHLEAMMEADHLKVIIK